MQLTHGLTSLRTSVNNLQFRLCRWDLWFDTLCRSRRRLDSVEAGTVVSENDSVDNTLLWFVIVDDHVHV